MNPDKILLSKKDAARLLSLREPLSCEAPRMSTEKITPLLVSKKSAKEYLGGLSVRTIEYAIAKGLLETRVIGRRRLIVYKSLVEFARRDHPGALAAQEVRQ